jgi:hypothetical protein
VVTITGTLWDDTALLSGELLIDGVVATTVSGTSLSYDWDTAGLSFGVHSLMLRAIDGLGTTVTESIVVYVDNPPVITILNPADGDTVAADVDVQVDVFDDEAVSMVELRIGGDSVDIVYAPPYDFVWNTCDHEDGPQTINIYAWDDSENMSLSSIAVTTLNVDADGDLYSEVCGFDCDDTDPSVYPGAVETWYDGIDSDCGSDSDYDADGDGFDALAWSGADCDDGDATDTPGDGIDQDCSGADAPTPADDLLSGELLVTEIAYDPLTGDDNYCEWFEIYNNTTFTIDVYGLVVSDDDAGSTGTITTHGELASGEFAILAKSDETTFAANCPELYSVFDPLAYYGTKMALGNSGDPLFLKTSAGLVIDDTPTCSTLWDNCQLDSAVLYSGIAPGALVETANDLLADWCASSTAFATDAVDSSKIDRGTPEAYNDVGCP